MAWILICHIWTLKQSTRFVVISVLALKAEKYFFHQFFFNTIMIDYRQIKQARTLKFGMNTSLSIIFIQNEICVSNFYGFGIIYKLEISKNNSWSNLYKDNDQTIRARSVIFGMDTYIIYRSMHIKYHIAASHHLLLISHNLQTHFCKFLSNFEKS